VPYANPDEQRRAGRESQRRRRAAAKAAEPGATPIPEIADADVKLQTTADCIASYELAVRIALRSPEVDPGTKSRLLVSAASAAARTLEARDFETRLAALEDAT